MKKYVWPAVTGIAIGVAALVLTLMGNPANMGFCIACFLRDIAGACKLHSAAPVQYMRPEILGLVLGSFAIALIKKEWRPVGGSSPMTRFLLGAIVMVGALVFLGCPLRMVIRLGGGDLNALVALAGFVIGILLGILFLKRGFSLGRAHELPRLEGLILPALLAGALLLALIFPDMFKTSAEGPGSKHALWIAALLIAGVVGALCQRSRLCMAGGVRDAVMFRDFTLLAGFLAILVTVLAGNLLLGSFKLGFEGQPVAHTDWVWNLFGMTVVGWGSVLLGGCPLRQLILAGEGNADSGVTILGYIAGAAACHNLSLASSAEGVSPYGPYAVIACFVILIIISFANTRRAKL